MSGGIPVTPPTRPVFIDNRDGNTLARAITTHLAVLRSEGRTPTELCVASCYFDPQPPDCSGRCRAPPLGRDDGLTTASWA